MFVPRVPGDAAELFDLQRYRDESHVLVGLAVSIESLAFTQKLGVLQKLSGVCDVIVFRGNEGWVDLFAPPRVRLLARRVRRVLGGNSIGLKIGPKIGPKSPIDSYSASIKKGPNMAQKMAQKIAQKIAQQIAQKIAQQIA